MKQCPNCYTPNTDESQYCESCGTPLRQSETSRPTSLPYQEGYAQYGSSPTPVQYPVPEPVYTPPPLPVSSTYAQNYPSAQQQLFAEKLPSPPPERRRSGAGLFFGILLYLIGGLIAAFGLAAIFVPANDNILVGSIFLIICLVSILVLIFTLITHRHPRIRGWLRIVLFISLTILSAIALISVFVVNPSAGQGTTPAQYIGMGVICLIYGVGLDFISIF